MHALTVLYGGSVDLSGESSAFQPVFKGQSAFTLALKQAAAFPGSKKTLLLAGEGEIPGFSASMTTEQQIVLIQKPFWTVSELLKTISEACAGFDFAYYAWADSPFLDAVLAGKIAERHTRYAAEYSYADGWPGGIGPELITGAAAGILYKIAGDAGFGPVKRDSLFTVLQKDINSFDIETEISDEDQRCRRLSFTADSKRNLLLLERFAASWSDTDYAGNCAGIIAEHPEYLRTLPAFFPIQV
ncbi:MAG: spiro-SPASM protein, partial [Treponema sp.]|nr:spiro-SPASM protein [Treponema sp.]